jgi:hypothetical protein
MEEKENAQTEKQSTPWSNCYWENFIIDKKRIYDILTHVSSSLSFAGLR